MKEEDCSENRLFTSDILQLSNNNSVFNNTLNTAFLLPLLGRPFPYSTSGASSNSALHFHSTGLDVSEPLKILSTNSEILNDGFLIDNSKLKTHSLSTTQHRKLRLDQTSLPDFKENCNKQLSSFIEYCNKIEDEEFDDSVFIEANNLALRISDGSIVLTDNGVCPYIDCTTPPEFVDIEEEQSKNATTEVIVKELDTIELCSVGLDCEENLLPENKIKESLSHIFRHSSKHSESRNDSSYDANQLLIDLSAIINNECRDMKQTKEGQQLLFSLAEILCSNNAKMSNEKCDSLVDSRHSSIEQEDQQNKDFNVCFGILDLRINKSDPEHALDLSMKISKEENKRLSQSFTVPQPPKLFIKHSQSISESSKRSILKSGTSSKLKSKKIENKKYISRGPLKAILPVMDMSKCKSFCGKINTPPKLDQVGSTFKNTKNSTPVNVCFKLITCITIQTIYIGSSFETSCSIYPWEYSSITSK
ncbi:hypothetical protein FQA39_LY06633 [Lamprigera yunnana]|nr:hypothetical protein FQA39_LY06633 [Lamprigera yunnana]